MVSSQVLQKTIDELRAITRIDLCVLSVEGQMLVTTRGDESLNADHVREFVQSPADSQVMQGYHFFKVYDDQTVEYVLVARGNSEDTYMIGKIAVCQIQNLIIAYKERLDKNNFIELTVQRNGTSKGSLLGNVIQSILLSLVKTIEFFDVTVSRRYCLYSRA